MVMSLPQSVSKLTSSSIPSRRKSGAAIQQNQTTANLIHLLLLLIVLSSTVNIVNSFYVPSVSASRSSSVIINNNPSLLISVSPTIQMVPPASSSSAADAAATATTTSNNNINNNNNPKPKLPIPEPIYSDIPGTWAYDTMSRRVDQEILQRTYQDNKDLLESKAFVHVKAKFDALRKDLQTASPLKMLEEQQQDDEAAASPKEEEEEEERRRRRQREWQEWKTILQPFLDRKDTWLTAPWMVTEFYVYRRLMEAFGYWDQNSPGYQYDPFAKQKRAGLESSVGSVRTNQQTKENGFF
jgi:Damage-control phosphatase ARMT1-like domain